MNPLTAVELAHRVGGRLSGHPSLRGKRVVVDPHSGIRPGDVFLGLKGPLRDENSFAADAIERGASVVITTAEVASTATCAVIHVDDGWGALRRWARLAREELSGTLVLLAGENAPLLKDLVATALTGQSVWTWPIPGQGEADGLLSLVRADPAADVVLVEGAPGLERFAPDLSVVQDPTVDEQATARRVAAALGLSVQEEALGAWRPAAMRLQVTVSAENVTLFNDLYPSCPESVFGALSAMEREPSQGRTWVVLGGFTEHGSSAERARRVAEALVDHRCQGLVAIGEPAASLADAAAATGLGVVERVVDLRGAAVALKALLQAGDRVLLKGRWPTPVELAATVLFGSLPPSVATIDLDQVVVNARAHQAAVAPARLMPVVKAAAYGLHPVRVAAALEKAGVAHLAVAYPEEGVLLRRRGVELPILVQNVLEEGSSKVVGNGLSAQVNEVRQLDFLIDEAARQQRPIRVHIKVDTGMGRSGCLPSEARGLAQRALASPWVVWEGVMTHFASADELDPDSVAFTQRQIARFDDVLAGLPSLPQWIHAANSAASSRFPSASYTLVRSGIALWGYGGVPGRISTSPVLRLTTRVLSVKTLPAHAPVGYGRTWSTGDAPRRIAVVAIGYADGYPRALSNRGQMGIGGMLCPVVGRVCMDVTMLDVTDVEGVRPGTTVVVYGSGPGEPDLLAMASAADTISYELLTRLTGRVRRVFESSL